MFFAQAQVVSPLRRGDGSVATVVARMASGKKVRIYENSRTIGAAILHILARERVPWIRNYSLSQLVESMRR